MTLSYLIPQIVEHSNYLFLHILSNVTLNMTFSHGTITVRTRILSYLTFPTYLMYFQISQKKNF